MGTQIFCRHWEVTITDIVKRFFASKRRGNGEKKSTGHIFRFRPISGDIFGHRDSKITLFKVRFSELVAQNRSKSYCDVF